MKKINSIYIALIFLGTFFSSCNKYLEIIPDDMAEVDMAFNMRESAIRYLATCYSHLPRNGDPTNGGYLPNSGTNPAFFAGLEADHPLHLETGFVTGIAAGMQNSSNPIGSYFEISRFWEGIRHCNYLIANVDRVPDMGQVEKKRWAAEVKVIKVYLHYLMFQHVGPIPIVDVNLDLNSSAEESRPYRQKVDDIIEYFIKTLNSAILDLPEDIEMKSTEGGRFSKISAMGLKAKILLTAASPLYNGNTDYANFLDHNNEHFFNQIYDEKKWILAKDALKEVIDLSARRGYKLFQYNESDYPVPNLSDTIKLNLNLRGVVTENKNSEVLWGNPASMFSYSIFNAAAPKFDNISTYPHYSVTVNHALEYYSSNGVPIEEDINWGYTNRFNIVHTGTNQSPHLQTNFQTLRLNLDREPRFYANLSFDGDRWFGQGKYSESSSYNIRVKNGDAMISSDARYRNSTGYYAKKIIPWDIEIVNGNTVSMELPYPWPAIRLADIYLSYAEALNEIGGPSNEVLQYIDAVRARAGLEGVVASWTKYSNNPEKPNTKDGLREIIHKEKNIEFGLEGVRFYDELRWKTAAKNLSGAVYALQIRESSVLRYNEVVKRYERQFTTRDYLFPIGQDRIFANRNLIQNPGW